MGIGMCLPFIFAIRKRKKHQCFFSPSGLRFKTKLDSQRYLFFSSSLVFLFYKTTYAVCKCNSYNEHVFLPIFSPTHTLNGKIKCMNGTECKQETKCKKTERRQYVREQKKIKKQMGISKLKSPTFCTFNIGGSYSCN